METENIVLRKLMPAEGKYLANKDNTICTNSAIYLGKNDSADNYREVDETEAKTILQAIEEAKQKAIATEKG
jgi:hypothetical protein